MKWLTDKMRNSNVFSWFVAAIGIVAMIIIALI